MDSPLSRFTSDLRKLRKDTVMEELVVMQNQQAVTTSLRVVDVFGKRHDNIMRDIEKLLKSDSSILSIEG